MNIAQNSKLRRGLRIFRENLVSILPKETAHKLVFKRYHGEEWNNNNPITYDDKIHWHMVHTYDGSFSQYADKYEVRKYVEECGLGDILIPLLDVASSADDIDFGVLPNQFILKATHASGTDFYEICTDKEKADINAITQKMNKAVHKVYWREGCEYQYRPITPRIVCEPLLVNGVTERLDDYKVVCVYGKPYYILVCTDRYGGRDYYSTEWEYMDFTKNERRSSTRTARPEVLSELLKDASILSEPFPIARVDFYIINNKIYFGEITLSPSAGNHTYLNEVGQKELGKIVPLTGARFK